ncbi:hypothetical protein ACFCZ3_20205 [Cellulosimicrobium cellulans]|uniref:hypothetical protein n=1 Tax=Cellulosimicrobium cellulans TaxID=1710 RepID=UPI0035DB9863
MPTLTLPAPVVATRAHRPPVATPRELGMTPAQFLAHTLADALVRDGDAPAERTTVSALTTGVAVVTVTHPDGGDRLRVVIVTPDREGRGSAPKAPPAPAFAVQGFDRGALLPRLRTDARALAVAHTSAVGFLLLTAERAR